MLTLSLFPTDSLNNTLINTLLSTHTYTGECTDSHLHTLVHLRYFSHHGFTHTHHGKPLVLKVTVTLKLSSWKDL